MKKQIRKIVNKTLGVTLVIVILLLAVINPILNAAFLNPMKLYEDIDFKEMPEAQQKQLYLSKLSNLSILAK